MLFNYALRGWRLDLTQNRLYTTAPGTDRILESIKEPINLYFFFSEKTAEQLPQLKSYGTRVRELLEELAARSDGKMHLHVIDPQPFSEEEDRAAELGVPARRSAPPAPSSTSGSPAPTPPTATQASSSSIPDKEQFLEYDVVKLIYQLANPKKPVVAWLSTLPMGPGFDPQSGQMREPWVVYSEAQQLFDVRPLAAERHAASTPTCSVLVLVHPKNLSPATAVRHRPVRAARRTHPGVRRSAGRGRSAPAADPQNPMAAMDADKSSHLEHAAHRLGRATSIPDQVVADRGHALSVTMHQGEAPVEHLGVLGLDKASFAADDVITAGPVQRQRRHRRLPRAGQGRRSTQASSRCCSRAPTRSCCRSQRFRMLFDPATLRMASSPPARATRSPRA